ncbi:hypothetical protein AVEN_44748-1 [Araneus ventricosus]|uniref:Uncharacterized protein n=1 Tax=Araneus ventricosus TaxID=182803 RepID=A0A4Y2HQQ4_ARAVE|nr:hypothetical protein AVEN_44748-1 [Araneus ventricosus]
MVLPSALPIRRKQSQNGIDCSAQIQLPSSQFLSRYILQRFMMSSDGDDCAALSEQISSTLHCDDSGFESKELCGSTTDQNEETQKSVDGGQDKCLEEENSREAVTENEKSSSDELIIQLLETDSDQEDTAGLPIPAGAPQDNKRPFKATKRTLAAVMKRSYVSGAPCGTDDDEEEDK